MAVQAATDVVDVITYSRRKRQDPSKATLPGVRSRTKGVGSPATEHPALGTRYHVLNELLPYSEEIAICPEVPASIDERW